MADTLLESVNKFGGLSSDQAQKMVRQKLDPSNETDRVNFLKQNQQTSANDTIEAKQRRDIQNRATPIAPTQRKNTDIGKDSTPQPVKGGYNPS